VLGERSPAARRAVSRLLKHAKELADATDQQPLFVDFGPRPGGRRKDNMVAGLDRHPDANVIPPVEPRPDCEDDPLLRWWLVGASRNE